MLMYLWVLCKNLSYPCSFLCSEKMSFYYVCLGADPLQPALPATPVLVGTFIQPYLLCTSTTAEQT